MRRITALTSLLVLVGAAMAWTPAAAGEPTGTYTTGSIQHDGGPRDYRLYVPSSYDGSTPVPLVIGMHGGCGSANQFATSSGWLDQAEADGFIAVFPRGLDAGPCAVWNGGRCCPVPPAATDDVGFILALLDELERSYAIDTSRVLATGMSNGGVMAYRLACEAPDRITMVGPVAGSQEVVPPCTPAAAVSVLAFHGDLDTHVPFEGGVGQDSLVQLAWYPVPAALSTWASLDGCDRTPSAATVDGVDRSSWAGCLPGASVRLVRIDDNPHAWPGGVQTPVGGVPSEKVDATAELAAFLMSGGRPNPFPAHGFPDVAPGSLFDPGVTWMRLHDITTGYADGTYRPAATVTRAQTAAFIFRLAGDPAFTPPAPPTFSDVPGTHPFAQEIEWLADTGITRGYADGTFRPSAAVTRSAFATQLWRLAGEPTAGIPAHPFTDVGPDDAIDLLAHAGITTGWADGTFRPQSGLNRGQAATFLHRLTGTPWA